MAVYEVRGRILAPRLVGQWLITVKYLATDPFYCHHTALRFEDASSSDGLIKYCPRRMTTNDKLAMRHRHKARRYACRWIVITAALSDAQWRPTEGEIRLRVRWRHRPSRTRRSGVEMATRMNRPAGSGVCQSNERANKRLSKPHHTQNHYNSVAMLSASCNI